MVIDERYKWLYPYTMACTGGNLILFQRIIESKKFKDFFRGDFSRQRVRDYFMGPHNMETLNGTSMSNLSNKFKFFHLAIPYEILQTEGGLLSVVSKPFYEELPNPLITRKITNEDIKEAKKSGVLEKELGIRDILIFHGLHIADCCKKQDLEKYNHLYSKTTVA